MKPFSRIAFAALLVLTSLSARADVTLIGSTSIPGDATDLSGLTDTLEDFTPHNRLGSFGSAIAYTGHSNRYVAVDDRGPSNGDVSFKCRFQTFDITIAPGEKPAVAVKLVATILLTDESGKNLVGTATEFAPDNGPRGLRFDPEGIRVSPAGTLYISDEYGPFVCEFDMQGRRLRTLPVPHEFSVDHPHAEAMAEDSRNTRGRVANKGFEGLAISPDGAKLYALLQAPLLQDGGEKGVNCRMLEIEIVTGKTRQFVVELTSHKFGFNELLAINSHEFLAIERDNTIGVTAKNKHIIKLDIAHAGDVSGIAALPRKGMPPGVNAVAKHPFIDMLDPRFGLAGKTFPEKIEGLAFGPDLPDGRRTLVVTSDNDLLKITPSWFWVFAISPDDLK